MRYKFRTMRHKVVAKQNQEENTEWKQSLLRKDRERKREKERERERKREKERERERKREREKQKRFIIFSCSIYWSYDGFFQ